MLREHPGRGAFLGGGTVLATRDDPGLDFVVDLGKLGLDEIAVRAAGTRLGATASLEAVAQHPELRSLAGGILSQAAARTRTEPWRRQATLAGRVLERDPADLVRPCLQVLEARVQCLDAPGETRRDLDLEAALDPDAAPRLWLAIDIATTALNGWALESLERSVLDTPLAAVLVGLHLRAGRIVTARIATSALATQPRRAPHAEAALAGRAPDAATFAAAQAALMDDVQPGDDHRASAEYRAHLGRVLLARALRRASQAAAPND